MWIVASTVTVIAMLTTLAICGALPDDPRVSRGRGLMHRRLVEDESEDEPATNKTEAEGTISGKTKMIGFLVLGVCGYSWCCGSEPYPKFMQMNEQSKQTYYHSVPWAHNNFKTKNVHLDLIEECPWLIGSSSTLAPLATFSTKSRAAHAVHGFQAAKPMLLQTTK